MTTQTLPVSPDGTAPAGGTGGHGEGASASGAHSPARPVLVFCDVDETLIRCKSLLDFLGFHFAERYGTAGQRHARTLTEGLLSQVAAGASREEANRSYFRAWAGENAAEVEESGRRWYARRSREAGFFLPRTRAALRSHRASGAVIALVSGSSPAVLAPLAAAVGAGHLVCARPRTRGGVLTGELIGDPVIGEGKRQAVRKLFAEHPGVAPADCYAYGDHVSDLPMLDEVGHPVIVGDDAELAALLPGVRRLA